MNMKVVKNIVRLFFIVFVYNLTFAHNPDEINYNFVLNKETQQLTIHFTPVAAFHLIQELHVELRMERALKLNDYLSDFEAYFNKTITLKTGNKQGHFHLIENDLVSHDATLTFTIENIGYNEEVYQITVSSFTEIFKRIKNDVTFNVNNNSQNCFLNKEDTECSFSKT